MKKILLIFFFSFIFSSCTQKEPKVSPGEDLKRLIQGNKRFVNNASKHPNRSEERRKEIASKQLPFAIIVGCSDSRVSPEIIFDEGLGDLFVVRVAGNVIGEIELESIEYSALYLNSKIILVMGHENCGAVNAVVQNQTTDIKEIAEFIEPAVLKAEKSGTNDLLERAIKMNAVNMKNFLKTSPNIQKLIQDKKIEVYAAYFNLKTGVVEILDE